jgi:hypothetical protein
MRVRAATMRRRIAGRLGCGGGPPPGCGMALFSPEPQMLEEGESELAQERVVVQAAPGAAFEVIEAQLVLHLLVHLLADPAGAGGAGSISAGAGVRRHRRARLDRCGQDLERRVGREVGQIVFLLAAGAMLADEPSLLAGQVLPSCGDRSIGHPHPDRGELGLERALVPVRHETVRNASGRASTSSAAATLSTEGTGCLRGRPAPLRSGWLSVTSAG